MIAKILALTRINTRYVTKNAYLFAKGDKPQKGEKPEKGGKKEDGGGGAVVKPVEQTPPEEVMQKYLATSQNGLSPDELQSMNEKFTDLTESEKKMLNSFADEILDLQTPSFIQFIKRGGLGTSSSLYLATTEMSDEDLNNSLKYLKKE